MNRILSLAIFLLALCSCGELPQLVGEETETEYVKVQFACNASSTKSSVGKVESVVNNYNLMVYSGGKLISSAYSEQGGAISLSLVAGLPYNIYALANNGEMDAPALESDLWNYRYRIDSRGLVAQFSEDGLPMACVQKGKSFSKGANTLNMELKRLVAKLRITVDSDALAGLGVSYVKLRNCASSIQPFPAGDRSGSRITSASDAIDGDQASMQDRVMLSMGRNVYFYVPENCQGTLLPGNTDPWNKTPENVSLSSLCTYLEVGCSFLDGYALTGDVTYRMFLGKDNCSNFDVCGNSDFTLDLSMTKDLKQLSWKIIPDISFEDGVASASITQGMHLDWNNLYIGETVRIRLSLNQYLEEYLSDYLGACKMKLLDNDLNPVSAAAFGCLEHGSNGWECDMSSLGAVDEGAASLWLCYPDGSPVCPVDTAESLVLKKPSVAILNRDTMGPLEQALSQPIAKPVPELGGKSVALRVYLLDSESRNINSSAQYAFSLDPFSGTDVVITPQGLVSQIASTVSVSRTMGTPGDDGPALVYTFSAANDGSNSSLNRTLSNFVSGTVIYDCRADFPNAKNALTFSGSVAVLSPILVTASSDSFMSGSIDLLTGNTSTSLLVCNPSKIYIKGEYCFLAGGYSSTVVPPTAIADAPVSFLIGCNDHHGADVPWFGRKLPFEIDPASVSPATTYPVNLVMLFKDEQQRTTAVAKHGTVASFNKYDLSASFGMSAMYKACIQSSKLVDLVVRNALGQPLSYYYEDLNGRYLVSGGLVQTSDRPSRWASGYKYLGGVGWGAIGRDVPDFVTGLCASYSPLNVDGLNSTPLSFAFRYDSSTSAAYLDISGNTAGNSIVVSVTPQFYGERIWTKANYGGNEYAYFTYNATKIIRNVTAASESIRLMTKVQMDNGFVYLNRNFWHESCGAVVNTSGNRYSALAMPTSMSFKIEIFIGDRDGRWVPYTYSVTNGPQQTIAQTIYYRTALGTYVQNSGVLPDGTSVGEHETASKVAVKYSDYSVYDNTTKYTYTPTAEFVFSQHQRYQRVK